MTWIKDLFQAAYDLTVDQRKKTVRITGWIAVGALALTLAITGFFAQMEVGAESPLWEISIKARVVLLDEFMGLGKWITTSFLAIMTWQAIDNSNLGKRIFHWHPADSEQVKSAKKLNAALILSALLAACAWVMK